MAKAGAAAKTVAKTAATTKEKPEVKVHEGIAELLKQHDSAAEQAASYLVQICELVERENISNPVLIKTIMEARGTSESSAKGQASRIRALLKDKESFQALKDGNVTVRAAVKNAQSRRTPTAANKQKAFDGALNKFTEAAKALGQDKDTILTTVEAALDKAGIK